MFSTPYRSSEVTTWAWTNRYFLSIHHLSWWYQYICYISNYVCHWPRMNLLQPYNHFFHCFIYIHITCIIFSNSTAIRNHSFYNDKDKWRHQEGRKKIWRSVFAGSMMLSVSHCVQWDGWWIDGWIDKYGNHSLNIDV